MTGKETVKKGEATRLTIENAAIQLFLEQGYHATSMRQIARGAGVALGGIYNHFSSKEQIFDQVLIEKHPYQGAGNCTFSNGAAYQMHIGGN
jgi:AcrR family transcriptional regulator